MKPAESAGVLRDVAMQTQVRALRRPGPQLGGVTSQGLVAGPAATPFSSAVGMPPNGSAYADGFELGRREGRKDGEAEGQQASAARCDDVLQRALKAHRLDAEVEQESSLAQRTMLDRRFEQLSNDFQIAATERLRQLEDDALALAFEAVCRLIGKGHGQSEQLAASIAAALGAMRDQPVLRLRIRPDGLALLAASPQGRALTESFGNIEWLPDPRIEGDGCILDNALGSVDARFETQLDRLRQLWTDAICLPADRALDAARP